MSSEQKALEGFDNNEGDEDIEWGEKKLSEVAEINPGSINDDSFRFDEIKYLDISSVGKGFIEELADYSLEEAPSRAKRTVKESDTVLSRVRPIREQFTLLRNPPDNLVVSTGFAVLRAKEEVDEKFLYYASTTPEMIIWMDNHTSGSAYPAVNLSTLKHAEIPVPPMPVQKKIGRILHRIDSKIETNNSINEILEEMAQTLFQSWFVDYEPYEDFKDFELGDIPENFKVDSLTSISDIVLGGTPNSSEDSYWGGDIVWAKAKDVSNEEEAFISSTEKNITQKGLEESSTEIAPKGSTIITARGTVGELAIPAFDMGINQSCYSLVPHRDEDNYFVYLLMDAILNDLMSRTHGTVFDTITKRTLNEQDVVIPSEKERNKFNELVTPIMEEIKQNQEENRELKSIRDTLLPKLMSGEIRVNVDGSE